MDEGGVKAEVGGSREVMREATSMSNSAARGDVVMRGSAVVV